MKSLASRCAPWYARCPNTYRHSYTHITHAHHTFTGDYPAYTVRLDVDDAAFLSELKRTHKTKIDSRTWAKGRAALAELAQNGRAIKDLFAQVLCAQNLMYIVLDLVLTGHLPRFSTRMRRRPLPVGAPSGAATFRRSTSTPWLRRSTGVETSLSRRKMPLLMAIITKAVIQEAASRGITTLDELTDEKSLS